MVDFLVANGGAAPPMMVNLVVILAAAGVVALIAHRLKLPTIPAYLVTGVLIGPHVMGGVRDPEDVRSLGSLAIVLLMFGIGLNMDISMMRSSLGRLVTAALATVVVTIAILWPGLMAAGFAAAPALVVAMALSISSTAVVMRVLQQRRQMQRMTGRLSVSISVVQDLAVIAMLMSLPTISQLSSGEIAPTASASPGGVGATAWHAMVRGSITLAGVGAILAVGRWVVPRLLREGARTGTGEVLTVLSVAFALGAAAGTTVLGLSAELGAFLGGFILSSTPFRHHLSGQVGTLRDLFMAVFFTVLGMALNPMVVASDWTLILGITATMIVVKSVVIAAGCWAIGATGTVALKVGMALSQAGEFAMVLLAAAMADGIVNESILSRITAVLVVSLIATPGLIALAERLEKVPWLRRTAPWISTTVLIDADQRRGAIAGGTSDAGPTPAVPSRHVIVAGYGIVGRAVADRLNASNATVTIIEMNVRTVQKQRELGRTINFGDVSDPEVLENAGIHRADALVLTVPDEDAVFRACRVARALNPGVFIIARTNFLSRAMVAIGLGANETVVEEMATAEAMDRLIQRVLGGPGSVIETRPATAASPPHG